MTLDSGYGKITRQKNVKNNDGTQTNYYYGKKKTPKQHYGSRHYELDLIESASSRKTTAFLRSNGLRPINCFSKKTSLTQEKTILKKDSFFRSFSTRRRNKIRFVLSELKNKISNYINERIVLPRVGLIHPRYFA